MEEEGEAGDALRVEVGVDETVGVLVLVGRGDDVVREAVGREGDGARVLVEEGEGDAIRSVEVTVGVFERGREEVGMGREQAERIMAMSTRRGNIKKPL